MAAERLAQLLTESERRAAAREEEMFRPFTPGEAMWSTLNKSSSPLALCVTMKGPLSVDVLAAALAHARAMHRNLASSVNQARGGVGQSPLSAIPLTSEEVPASTTMADMRAITRRELLVGVTITETFLRCHLVTVAAVDGDGADAADRVSYVLLIADHVCFDGRSFFSVLEAVMSALPKVLADPTASYVGPKLGFGGWEDRVPDVELPSYTQPEGVVKIDPRPPSAATEGSNETKTADAPETVMVEDVVADVDASVFAALKATSKAVGSKLNGPLNVAFNCAIADLAIKRGATATKMPVVCACAVDVRRVIQPHLAVQFVPHACAVSSRRVTHAARVIA